MIKLNIPTFIERIFEFKNLAPKFYDLQRDAFGKVLLLYECFWLLAICKLPAEYSSFCVLICTYY
jgi:hypothetical protein